MDTVSRQSFGDVQETQFSGSKMEVNVHLKNAFQAELETEGSRLTTIFGLLPAPRHVSTEFQVLCFPRGVNSKFLLTPMGEVGGSNQFGWEFSSYKTGGF